MKKKKKKTESKKSDNLKALALVATVTAVIGVILLFNPSTKETGIQLASVFGLIAALAWEFANPGSSGYEDGSGTDGFNELFS